MELQEAFSDAERIFAASKTGADRACMVRNGYLQRLHYLFNTTVHSRIVVATGVGEEESSPPDIKLVLLLLKCFRNCVIECENNAVYIYCDGSMFAKLDLVCKWVLMNHYVKDAGVGEDDAGDSAVFSDCTYDRTYSEIALVMNQFIANFTACGDDMKNFVWTSDSCRDLFSNLIAVAVLAKNKKALMASIAAIINSIKCETPYFHISPPAADDDIATNQSYRVIDIFAAASSRSVLSQWLLSVMDLQRSKHHDDPDDIALLQWNHMLAFLIVEEGITFRILQMMQPAGGGDSGGGDGGMSHEQVVLLRLLHDIAEDPAAQQVLLSSPDTAEMCRWLARSIVASEVGDILNIESLIITDRHEERLSINQKLLVESTPLLMRLLSALLALLPADVRAGVGRSAPLCDHCLRLLVRKPSDGSEEAIGDKLAATRAIAASFDPSEENTVHDALRSAMQLLSNLVYRCEELQDDLRELGGLPVVLSRSATDFSNPLMREWALLCLRNACEGNQRNQKFIEELKLQAVVDRENVLGQQGVHLDVDRETGKITVVKTTPTTTTTTSIDESSGLGADSDESSSNL